MLITPLSGWSIQRKISAVIMTEAAHGAISAQRATRRPGNRWLNSCAMPSESSMVMLTTVTTQTTVRTRIPGRFGLPSSWLKFLVPAEPIVTPIGVMFCSDVWTRATIGHTTTTAISATAGPSQASGARRCRARRPWAARRGRGRGRAGSVCSPAAWTAAAVSGTPTQLPVLAVCWIAFRMFCGLPVIAWPSVVLIWFSTVVQLVADG